MKLQVRKIGNSFGIILPKELLETLNVGEGDQLFISENDGGATLTAYDPDFDKVMAAYDKFSRQYRNALKELSK